MKVLGLILLSLVIIVVLVILFSKFDLRFVYSKKIGFQVEVEIDSFVRFQIDLDEKIKKWNKKMTKEKKMSLTKNVIRNYSTGKKAFQAFTHYCEDTSFQVSFPYPWKSTTLAGALLFSKYLFIPFVKQDGDNSFFEGKLEDNFVFQGRVKFRLYKILFFLLTQIKMLLNLQKGMNHERTSSE